EVYPSQDAIANRMGVSKRTVQRAIDRLESLKLIEVKPTPRGGKYNGRNIYNLKPLSAILEQAAPNLKNRMAMAREWKMDISND
ncbi:helix-turn-helix domain-containing protein, partial [Pseudomonas sp. Irchel s3f7]|uniref:helix-turn-helix domain-containing protein n=1 Tax=Pseudomonas sp. Irchel s3f7 TaxID=2009153 RepID=UPI00117A3CC8